MRRSETAAEERLWTELRGRRLGEFKFRRQHPVPPYVLDFACRRLKLAVEVDGATHGTDEEVLKDAKRTAFLEAKGWTVIRFTNEDVFKHMASVLDAIWHDAMTLKGKA